MRLHCANIFGVIACAWLGVAVAAGPVCAQSGPRSERRWEIEAYGGGEFGGALKNGTPIEQPAGAPLTTSSATFPTRAVSSWFFGDGARLLNDVNNAFGVPARVIPLETALDEMKPGPRRGPAAGVRVRRVIAPGLSLELSADWLAQSITIEEDASAAIESVRAGYEAAFTGLLSTGPFKGATTRAVTAAGEGTSREFAVTAGANFDLASGGAMVPYLTIGAGTIARTGTLPSVTLTGRSAFSIAGTVPVQETDRLTIRFAPERKFVAVVGGGVRRGLTNHLGLRLDGRVLVSGPTARLVFDAEPGSVRGTPAGYIESFTTPSIQFSNDPATGRRSSLSGPALRGYAPFNAAGLQTRFLLTVGVSARF